MPSVKTIRLKQSCILDQLQMLHKTRPPALSRHWPNQPSTTVIPHGPQNRRFCLLEGVKTPGEKAVGFLSRSSQKRNLEINIGTADIEMLDVLCLRSYRVRPINIDYGNQPDRSPSQNICLDS